MKRWARGVLIVFLLSTLLPVAAVAAAPQSQAPAKLSLAVIPPALPANSGSYPALVLSLLDGSGRPTMLLSDLTVYLSSSNASVVSTPPAVTLPAGHSFLQVVVTTSSAVGKATVAAASTGLETGSVSITTVHPRGAPVALSLYVSPSSTVQAAAGEDVAYAVALTSSKGSLAVSNSDTNLLIMSSNSSVMGAPLNVTIPAGATAAYGEFKASAPGRTTLTALSTNLATAKATLAVIPAAAQLAVSATPQVLNGTGSSSITVSATFLGMPLQGLNVTLVTPQGTLVPASVVTNSAGKASSIYVAGQPGNVEIIASVSYPVVGRVTGGVTVTVVAPPGPVIEAKNFLSGYMALIPVVVVLLVVVGGVLIIRRTLKQRSGVVEEDDYDEAAAPAKA